MFGRIKPQFQHWKERAKIPIFERLRPQLKSSIPMFGIITATISVFGRITSNIPVFARIRSAF